MRQQNGHVNASSANPLPINYSLGTKI